MKRGVGSKAWAVRARRAVVERRRRKWVARGNAERRELMGEAKVKG